MATVFIMVLLTPMIYIVQTESQMLNQYIHTYSDESVYFHLKPCHKGTGFNPINNHDKQLKIFLGEILLNNLWQCSFVQQLYCQLGSQMGLSSPKQVRKLMPTALTTEQQWLESGFGDP